MRTRYTLALTGAALILAACTSGGEPAVVATSTSTTATATATATTTPSAEPTPSPTHSARPTLVLMGDGLGVQGADTSITKLLFGEATAAQVDAAITATLGKPERQTMSECGQGPRIGSQSDRFTVLYDGTEFLGWTEPGAPGRHLTSTAGIGIGSTLAEVRAVQAGVQTMDETLGPEFFTEGGISGMLDGLKPASKVTLVYVGETCFFPLTPSRSRGVCGRSGVFPFDHTRNPAATPRCRGRRRGRRRNTPPESRTDTCR